MGQIVPFPLRSLRAPEADRVPMGCDLPWYLPRQGSPGSLVSEPYRNRRVVSLDFETTNAGNGDAREASNSVVLAVTKRGRAPARVRSLDELREDLAAAEVLVCHNAKFELHWLARLGMPWEHLLVWDTMIAEKVKHGNVRVPLSLDACCKRRGLEAKDPLIDALMKGGVCPSEQPEYLVEARCLRDVETTYQLFTMQRKELSEKQRRVVFTRCIFTPVLAAIEREGVWLSIPRVNAEYDRVSARLAVLERDLAYIAKGRNLRSPLQLAEVLYDILKFPPPKRFGKPLLTKRGWRPASQIIMRQLKPKTKKQAEFLEKRKEYGVLNARMTKVLRFMRAVCEDRGGHFYADFHQTRTATDRLSSTARPIYLPSINDTLGIQLQNLPRDYKRLFCSPDPNSLMTEVDGAQLEFVVAGFLGQDKQVCHDIMTGEDVHRFSASVLFNKPESAVTSQERTAAKAETFKPLYGGRSGTPGQMAYYEEFRKKYNGVYKTQMGWVATVLRDKKLEMPWGATFYFPNARMGHDGYCPDAPNIFNYPVQSLATAEIIPISLTYLYWRGRLNEVRGKLINTIHDSGVALVHREDVAQYKQICQQAFFADTYYYLDKVYGLDFNVPLGLGFKAGEFWGEGDEDKFRQQYRSILAA